MTTSGVHTAAACNIANTQMDHLAKDIAIGTIQLATVTAKRIPTNSLPFLAHGAVNAL